MFTTTVRHSYVTATSAAGFLANTSDINTINIYRLILHFVIHDYPQQPIPERIIFLKFY